MTQIKRIIGGNENFTVFGVRTSLTNESDFSSLEITEFLIFEDDNWVWVDSKYFIPVDTDNKKR